MTNRSDHFEAIIDFVDLAIKLISELRPEQCFQASYLESEFIPKLGLNNESLNEQPAELSQHFGLGLHLWQYPIQLSKFLVWLSYNAQSVRRYMEIGSRWGGTFILISEWLKKIGSPLQLSIAVDPIDEPPFIRRYREKANMPVFYLQSLSTTADFVEYINVSRPDFVFVDGDHSMRGVMNDHLLVRKFSDIIVHHDVFSQSCPDTTLFWQYIKNAEESFQSYEFIDQYPSVKGRFLGIGALKRKAVVS